jgi:hypothetical protein
MSQQKDFTTKGKNAAPASVVSVSQYPKIWQYMYFVGKLDNGALAFKGRRK